MTNGPPGGLLVRFALPLMARDLIQQLYTLADSIVVGRLIGVNAFAAVGAAGSCYWLILFTLMGIGHGFGALIARFFGAVDLGATRRSIALSLLLALIGGTVLSLISVFLTKPVLILMRTPAAILDDTCLYLGILAGGIAAAFLNSVLGAVFGALGDSCTPLYAFIGSSILNITLDILLVLWTPWGVGAVAAATVVSQALSALGCFIFLVKRRLRLTRRDFIRGEGLIPKNPLCGGASGRSSKVLNPSPITSGEQHTSPFRARLLIPEPALIKELLRLGLPIGVQNEVAALGGLVIQYFVNGYGPVFIAGVAAAKRLYSLLFIIGSGLSGAVTVFTAQNYGAGRLDRIKGGTAAANRIMFAGLALIIPVMLFFGRLILGLFITGNGAEAAAEAGAVLDTAENQLRVCLVLLPALYLLFLYRSVLQGMGNSFVPMLSGLLEAVLRILAVLILPLFLGPWGVYIAEPAGWPFMAVQLHTAYQREIKKSPGPIKNM